MWSRRDAILRGLALTGLLALGACQVRPLYAPHPTGGPQADLPAISVDEPVSRQEQVFRNALLFGLRGGGEGDPPRYELIYRLTIREQEILIEHSTRHAQRLSADRRSVLPGQGDRDRPIDLWDQRDGDQFLHALLAELCQHPRAARRRGPPCRGPCRADTGAPRRVFRNALVLRHRGFDGLVASHCRMGRFSGATRSSMLLGTPGWRRMRPLRSRVTII